MRTDSLVVDCYAALVSPRTRVASIPILGCAYAVPTGFVRIPPLSGVFVTASYPRAVAVYSIRTGQRLRSPPVVWIPPTIGVRSSLCARGFGACTLWIPGVFSHSRHF